VLSARDLLAAAAREELLLVAFCAPSPAAIAGFARAARDAEAPLLLVRPSGAAEEKGPQEARDDIAFVDSVFRAAEDVGFRGPVVLLKDPPRAGSAIPDGERVQREVEAGFTGVSLAAADTQPNVRDAALAATAVCQMELGLEIVPLGGSAAAAELARQLRSRGAPPSAVRVSGLENDAEALAAELRDTALSTATESIALHLPPKGLRQLVASGPFLRALRRALPRETWDELQAWADENGATPEQSAARHQRLLRDLPVPIQARVEALCCFEGLDLLRKAGCRSTSARLIAAIAALHQGED
jgi:predicted nucleic acid-binding protein